MEKSKYKFYTYNQENTSMAPQYKEFYTRAGYVSYGEDNLYPDYLISLMNRSAKHNAILKRKASMIAGNGWNLQGLDGIATQFIYNPFNEMNLNEIVYRTAYDLEIFGAFALEIIYSKDRTKIAEINYIPCNKVRLSENREYVYYSDDWTNLKKFGPIKKQCFDPKNPVASQILYYKEYRPGVEYYGQPSYLSAVNWITLEYEISAFHLNQVQNGFAPGMIVNFTSGIPSDEEMQDIVRQLRADFESARNAGKTMFLFSDGQDRAAQINPVELNNSDERFIQLNKEITEGILTGHGVTNPALFGIAQPGEIGSKNTILESLEIFQSMYIEPKMLLIEKVYNRLLRINGSQTPLRLNEYKLNIEKIEEGGQN